MREMLFLDLCFKQKLGRRVFDLTGWPELLRRAGQWLNAMPTFMVVASLSDRAPLNARARLTPQAIGWDAGELRLSLFVQPHHNYHPVAALQLLGFNEDTYGGQIETLAMMPGLDTLTDDNLLGEFERYTLSCLRQHPTKPLWFRIESLWNELHFLAGGRFKSEPVIVYVPPARLDAITRRQTPTQKTLPTVPTIYESEEEAALLPALLDLWESDDDMRKDCAVILESEGAAGMERVRVGLACYRTQISGLPQLIGSAKQVTWAVALREQFMEQLRAEKRIDKSFAERIRAEVMFVTDSKDWINHRHNLMDWFDKKAHARKPLDPAVEAILKPV